MSVAFIGIYDGHGGGAVNPAVDFVREFLADEVTERLTEIDKSDGVIEPEKKVELAADVMREAFRETDAWLHKYGHVIDKFLCFRIPHLCRKVGSTAAVLLILDSHFIFANAGDSKIILVRGGSIAFETVDHNPSNEGERKRIRNSANVFIDESWMFKVRGYQQHALSVSRGFGDFVFKEEKGLAWNEQAVSAEPEVTVLARDEKDEFIVVASDGLWHFVSPEDVQQFVRRKLYDEKVTTERCVAELLELCFVQRKSTDNISIIIMKFQ